MLIIQKQSISFSHKVAILEKNMLFISGTFWIFLIVACASYIYFYWKKQTEKYASFDVYPGPSIGELLKLSFVSFNNYETYQYLINLNKNYGPVVKLWLKPFQPALQVSSVEFFEKLLVSKEHLRKTEMFDVLQPALQEGLANIKSVHEWRTERKLINTGFRPNNVEKYLPILELHLTTYIHLMEKQTGKIVDLQESMHLLLLDIAYHSLTGQNFSFQIEENTSIINAIIKYFDISARRLYSPILMNDFLFRMTKYYKEMKNVLTSLHTFTENVVKNNNQNRQNGKIQYIIDFLSGLGLPEKKVQSHFDTFIVAAEGTSAVAVSFTLFELATRPEVQQKIVDEIESTLERHDGKITISAINDMKYLDSVIKETMRVNAVVPIVERYTGNDIEIDGVLIPKDTKIIFNIHELHKTEEYFENAETFDPERFLPENMHKIRKYAYAPFSLGPRDCIGKHVAAIVGRYLLIRVLRHFEIHPVKPKHKMEIINEIIVKSANGIPVILKRRVTK